MGVDSDTARTLNLIEKLRAVAGSCSQISVPSEDLEEAAIQAAACFADFLKVELCGKGTVGPYTPWSVVKAMGRAFPLLLSKSIHRAELGAMSKEDCLHAWSKQAVQEGLAGTFLVKLLSQPQVLAAYGATAPARSKEKVNEVAALLQSIQASLSCAGSPTAAPSTSSVWVQDEGLPRTQDQDTRAAATGTTAFIETDVLVLEAKLLAAAARQKKPSWGLHRRTLSNQGRNDSDGAPAAGASAPLVAETGWRGDLLRGATAAAGQAVSAAALGSVVQRGAWASVDFAMSNLAAMPGRLAGFGRWNGIPSAAAPAAVPTGLDATPAPGGTTDTSPENIVAAQPLQANPGVAMDVALPADDSMGASQPAGCATAASTSSDDKAATECQGLVECKVTVVPTDRSDPLDKRVVLTLTARPQPAAQAAGLGSWVYDAAASTVGMLLAQGSSWALRGRMQQAAAPPGGGGSAGGGPPSGPGGCDLTGGDLHSDSAGSVSAVKTSYLSEVYAGDGYSGSMQDLPSASAAVASDDEDAALEDLQLVLTGGFDGHGWRPRPPAQTVDAVGAAGISSFEQPRRAVSSGLVRNASQELGEQEALRGHRVSVSGDPLSEAGQPRREACAPGQAGACLKEEVAAAGTAAAAGAAEAPMYGDRIRLHFDLMPSCSEQQQWQKQAGRCAGCDVVLEQAQQPEQPVKAAGTAGYLWGGGGGAAATGPRTCWYTGRLYCCKCHRGETSVLPSRVLHSWDFAARPVCCLARDYLEAIREQPLLCVTAINPGLYTKVPLLGGACELRQRVRANMAAASTGGEESTAVTALKRKAGQRAYLLGVMEDFWSLSDLVDLSKGVLSGLSRWLARMETESGSLSK